MKATRACTKCGTPIPPERLEARPETRLCETCEGEPDFRTVRPGLEEPPRAKDRKRGRE